MDETKYTVRTLAVMHGWTYADMADATGIKARRLMDINAGITEMTAKELFAIAEATGIPADRIEYRR